MNWSRLVMFSLLWFLAPWTAHAHSLNDVDLTNAEDQVADLVNETHRRVDADRGSPDTWGQLGMVLQAHGFNEAAVAHYEQAIKRDLHEYRWPYLAGDAIVVINPGAAAEFFADATKKNVSDLALFVAYGDVLTRLGRIDEAKSTYDRARRLKRDSPYLAIGLARLSLMQGDVNGAKQYLEKALDTAPRNAEAHTLLAQVYIRTGEPIAAEQSALLAKAHKFRAQPASEVIEDMAKLAINSDAYEARANRLLRQGDLDGATTAYRHVLTLGPRRARDLSNLAAALAELGNAVEAAPLFDEALKLAPDDALILTQAGHAESQRGALEVAQTLFDRAMHKNPESARTHLELARLSQQKGNPTEAIDYYEHALTLDPSLYNAYLELGQAHAKRGNLDKAQEAWQMLLTIEPDHSAAWRSRGFAYAYAGNYTLATPALINAYRIDPTHTQASLILALLLSTSHDASTQERELALSITTRAYRVQPRDPLRTTLLATAFAANGEFDKATEFGQRALDRAGAMPTLTEAISGHLKRYQQRQSAALPDDGCESKIGHTPVLVCSLIEPR